MLAGMLVFPALALLAVALLVALCSMTIWRAVTAPPEVSRATSCGGCGHEISTLAAGRCPECGADLLRVGLATRRMAVTLRGSLLMAIMAWTVLVGLASAVIGYSIVVAMMMSSFGPGGRGFSTNMSGSISPAPRNATPRTAPAYTIAYTMNSSMGGMGGVSGSLSLDLATPAGGAATATIDLTDTSYTILDATGAEVDAGTAFNAAAAERFYQSAGLTVSGDADLTAEKDEIALWVRDASRQPFSFGQSNMFGGNAAPSPLMATQATMTTGGGPFALGGTTELIIAAVAVVAAAAVYLIGIVVIIRRRNRLLRA